jgi:predicted phosphodiesterase
MYLKVVSDLHLEFGVPFEFASSVYDEQTVCIIAGDIDVGPRVFDAIEKFVNQTKYLAYIYIPGNHEFYRQDFDEMKIAIEDAKKRFAKKYGNVYISHDLDSIVIDGIEFVFGTMWTDGGKTLKDQRLLGPFMSDFSVIRKSDSNDGRFGVIHMRVEFFNFVDALADCLEKSTAEKIVLITHHMPDYQCIDPQYATSSINGGFAVDLIDYIPSPLLSKIDVMVFGHTHSQVLKKINISDSNSSVQLICNPRGYPRRQLMIDHVSFPQRTFENTTFDPELLFDLNEMVFE